MYFCSLIRKLLYMDSVRLKDKEFDLFISEDAIVSQISKLADQMNADLYDKQPIFIVVLNGAFMFASELIGRFNHLCEVTFIRLQSYQGTERGEKMREVQGLVENIKGRHVIIVEDIIDTGHTMTHLLNILSKDEPASVRIATLLYKPKALQKEIVPDYVAIEIPNDFIVGYGLDYDGYGRNLKNIYKVKTNA